MLRCSLYSHPLMKTQVVATDGRDDIAQQDSLAQSSAAVKEEAADLPAASQQPAADGDVQTVVVRVEYELQPSTTGLCFQGSYAHTNNQVRCYPGYTYYITKDIPQLMQ